MPLNDVAKYLESQGRNGDTMLMHVNPTELQVLEAMLGKTTRNPHTGLPEAFSWTKLLAGLGAAAAIAFTGGAAAPVLAPLIAAGSLGSAIADKGKPKDATSEAGKYLDKRTDTNGGADYKFAPPMTMLQSIADRPDLLGRQKDHYLRPISPMGRGFGEEMPVGYAQGGLTEAQAKDTVLALLSRMQEQQQGQQPMAHGRMVQGEGTGLSDSVPARLSDGEYVISADVVSMIGDGSSQAGGKRLDALMAQVRRQKTGSKKQAKPLGGVMNHG